MREAEKARISAQISRSCAAGSALRPADAGAPPRGRVGCRTCGFPIPAFPGFWRLSHVESNLCRGEADGAAYEGNTRDGRARPCCIDPFFLRHEGSSHEAGTRGGADGAHAVDRDWLWWFGSGGGTGGADPGGRRRWRRRRRQRRAGWRRWRRWPARGAAPAPGEADQGRVRLGLEGHRGSGRHEGPPGEDACCRDRPCGNEEAAPGHCLRRDVHRSRDAQGRGDDVRLLRLQRRLGSHRQARQDRLADEPGGARGEPRHAAPLGGLRYPGAGHLRHGARGHGRRVLLWHDRQELEEPGARAGLDPRR